MHPTRPIALTLAAAIVVGAVGTLTLLTDARRSYPVSGPRPAQPAVPAPEVPRAAGSDAGQRANKRAAPPAGVVAAGPAARSIPRPMRRLDPAPAREQGQAGDALAEPEREDAPPADIGALVRDEGPREHPTSAPERDGKGRAARSPEERAHGLASRRGSPPGARDFLAERDRIEGLTFLHPAGYWSNRYLPGDPGLADLSRRLRAWDRGGLGVSGPRARLEARVSPNRQFFDPPQRLAVDLHLGADRRALPGPTRVLFQVGLSATGRRPGARSPMSFVLAARMREGAGRTSEQVRRLAALVRALRAGHRLGDRFALVIWTPGTYHVVPPETFRNGPVEAALRDLLAPARPIAPDAPHPEWNDALDAAYALLPAPGEGDGVGTAHLLLAASDIEDLPAVEQRAHRGALQGITTSAVALTSPPADAHLAEAVDRIAGAGQGRRRVLADAGDATRLIEQELHASSRAVAHALRLRIRLAEGVRLVEVIGAHRLDEPAAARTRAAERSLDQRLEAHLGIRADRGDDEEGIQVVIPTFYAGDTHVLLLDLVADGPGAVADVQLRYKDLVHAGNAIVAGNLSLPGGDAPRGTAELSVMKNALAAHLAETLRGAHQRLSGADHAGALRLLRAGRDLLLRARTRFRGWHEDAELGRDVAVLDDYIAVIEHGPNRRPVVTARIAGSLELAAHRRLMNLQH